VSTERLLESRLAPDDRHKGDPVDEAHLVVADV
jgi:hypothetical protein